MLKTRSHEQIVRQLLHGNKKELLPFKNGALSESDVELAIIKETSCPQKLADIFDKPQKAALCCRIVLG